MYTHIYIYTHIHIQTHRHTHTHIRRIARNISLANIARNVEMNKRRARNKYSGCLFQRWNTQAESLRHIIDDIPYYII